MASPLGLRLIMGAEGEKIRDFDFLSSIEVLIVDQVNETIPSHNVHMITALSLSLSLSLSHIHTHTHTLNRIDSNPRAFDSWHLG